MKSTSFKTIFLRFLLLHAAQIPRWMTEKDPETAELETFI